MIIVFISHIELNFIVASLENPLRAFFYKFFFKLEKLPKKSFLRKLFDYFRAECLRMKLVSELLIKVSIREIRKIVQEVTPTLQLLSVKNESLKLLSLWLKV